MMAFFNGKKRSKLLVVTVLIMTLIVTYAVPMTVFAEDSKPAWNDYKDDPQTAIDPSIVNDVKDAQEQSAEAEKAAEAAKTAAEEAEKEASKAEAAAADAENVANDAGQNTTSAEAIHEEGAEYINATKAAIEIDVNTAKNIIEEQAEIASGAAVEAEHAANEAEAAKLQAQNATSSAVAAEAALAAKAAADRAQEEANKAKAAYDEAQNTLDAAKNAYEAAVAAANVKVAEYNNQIDSYKDTVNNLNILRLKAAYDAAEEEAKTAKAAADVADAKAKVAALAAAVSADAVINYHVDPATLARDEAQQAKEKADAEKELAAQTVVEKQNLESEKKGSYESVVPSVTENARIAQKQEADRLKGIEESAKAAYDKLGWVAKAWQETWNIGEYKAWKDAKEAREQAESSKAYNSAIDRALKATPEYQALVAAQSELAAAKAEDAAKAAAVAEAQRLLLEREAALKSAVTTRDEYLAEIKKAVGDEAIAQILEALNQRVDQSEGSVNKTIFDGDMYQWANKVKDDVWWQIWKWDVYADAAGEAGKINETYTKQNFTDWLNQTFPWIHNFKNTDEIIKIAEAAYRQELKLNEERLASNQAYLAKLEAAKAAAAAAERQAEAAEAIARLVAANEKLTAAETALEAAQKRVNELTKLNLDLREAFAALQKAEALVGQAKLAKENAESAAGRAKEAADAAQKRADELVLQESIKFYVLIDGERPTIQGSQSTDRFTGVLYTLPIIAPEEGTPGTGMSLVNEFGDEANDTVENRVKEQSSTASFDALQTAVREALKQNYSNYLPQGDNWNVDWYDFKWEGDGWHVDGEVKAEVGQTVTSYSPTMVVERISATETTLTYSHPAFIKIPANSSTSTLASQYKIRVEAIDASGNSQELVAPVWGNYSANTEFTQTYSNAPTNYKITLWALYPGQDSATAQHQLGYTMVYVQPWRTYTVEYYKDDVLVAGDTASFSLGGIQTYSDGKRTTANPAFSLPATIDENKYVGFSFDHKDWEDSKVIKDGDVLKVYYVSGKVDDGEQNSGSEDNSNTDSGRRGDSGIGNTTPSTPPVILQDEQVPAGPAPDPESEIIIEDEAIPAGPLPKTGGLDALILYGLGTLLAGGGFALRRREKNK